MSNSINQYIPIGSYRDACQSIRVTINANCKTANGAIVSSAPLEYSIDTGITDIANLDGKLTLVPGTSSTPNPNNKLGPYIPAGSYQLSSQDVSITINAVLNIQIGGGDSSVTLTAKEAVNIKNIYVGRLVGYGGLIVDKRMAGNPLDNAKLKWTDASNYDQLKMDESTLLGVQADGNIFVVNPDSGVSTMSVEGGVIVTKTLLGPSYKVVGSAAVMRVANNESIGGIDTVDVTIFEAHAEAELQPLYAGAGVGFNLAGGSASIFDFNLGAGLSTGAGLKDESIELKVAGTGVTVGKKISISVLDNSFGVDLKRTASAVWFVGKELYVAVAVVPGALKDGGVSLLKEFKEMPSEFASAGGDLWTQVKQIPGAFADIPGAFADAGKSLWKTFD